MIALLCTHFRSAKSGRTTAEFDTASRPRFVAATILALWLEVRPSAAQTLRRLGQAELKTRSLRTACTMPSRQSPATVIDPLVLSLP
jgi:hypothetical protein